MTDRELLELVLSQVGKLTSQVNDLSSEVKVINDKLDHKADKADIVRFENTITPKITSLYDGYKQNSEKLDRIEKEVKEHEDFIVKRVK